MQITLRRETTLVGLGLHGGRPVRMTLRPAVAGGIRFRRTDARGLDPVVPARWDLVADTRLCTRLSNADGVSVGTVEHLMAALAGTGITQAVIDLDGAEVPIMDGSARRFVQAIFAAGLRRLPGPLTAYRVLRPVRVEADGASASLAPAPSLEIDFAIDFSDRAIGRQSRRLSMVNGAFVRELADCRTFCRRVDVEAMHAEGLARGGSLDNSVVVDGDAVLNPGGFRRADECVRHKMLDAFGDLALAGAPILGAYCGIRAGHGLTNRLLRRLFAEAGAVAEVRLDAETASQLPGAGLGVADVRRAG